MKVLVAGSSGLVGRALVKHLEEEGHQVVPLVRPESKGRGIVWDPERGLLDPEKVEGFDALINLCGESIVQRWTDLAKKRITGSRVLTTRLLAKTLLQLKKPPSVWINASAIGYYGYSGGRVSSEISPPGKGFLAEACVKWEAELEPAMRLQTRVIALRIGAVLSGEGGLLKRMLLPFRLGLGGVVGSGEQEMSWIDIEDLVRAIGFCLNAPLRGPVNAVAPEPVSNRTFTKTLGKALHRWTPFPMPAWMARLAFGELAEEILLNGQEVVPSKLEKAGFTFLYPTLESSLTHLIKQD